MRFHRFVFILSAAVVLSALAGCQKTEPPVHSLTPTMLSPDTIAHVRWLGKRQLGYEATAYFLMRIWNLPQSKQLEQQTLYKLTANSPGWLPNGARLANDDRAWLWPLLNDLVQEESYLEIRQPAGQPAQSVLAVHLTDTQSDQWFTNVSGVLVPLTSARALINPVNHDWTIKTENQSVWFRRVSDWTLVAFGPDPNPLADDLAARIRRDGVPFVSSGTNLWLEASLDLPRLVAAFPAWKIPATSVNHLDFSLTGDGGNVFTRAKITLTKPFPAELPPWHLPPDFFHGPLTTLTAVRSLQPWLADWSFWRDLQIGAPPDECFVWSLDGNPYELYAAAPLPEPRRQFPALMNWTLSSANALLDTNGYVSFRAAPDGKGVLWGNQPNLQPFVKFAGTPEDGWLFAGLNADTNAAPQPVPPGLIQDILRRTNLVYYDWEVTGPRLQPALQVYQLARQLAHAPDLPLNCPSLACLGALIPRLGTSATIVSRTGPAELSLVRRSTVGLTSTELLLLAGWLESPNFPR